MEEVLDANGLIVCQRMIEKSLQRSPTVKFMIQALQKSGCPITETFFKSENCSVEAAGGFVPQIEISVCSNHLQTTQGEVDQMTNELVHAYDHCRAANLDWSNCQHACSEIRAANLSGDCKWTLELLRGHTNFRQQQQVCVRRRANFLCPRTHSVPKQMERKQWTLSGRPAMRIHNHLIEHHSLPFTGRNTPSTESILLDASSM